MKARVVNKPRSPWADHKEPVLDFGSRQFGTVGCLVAIISIIIVIAFMLFRIIVIMLITILIITGSRQFGRGSPPSGHIEMACMPRRHRRAEEIQIQMKGNIFIGFTNWQIRLLL